MWVARAFIVGLSLLLVGPSSANFAIFQVSSNQNTWQTAQIGGGGWVRGLDIECDAGFGSCNNSNTTTAVVRTDTYGAYVWVTAGKCQGSFVSAPCWQQLVNTQTIPSSDPMNSPTACLLATNSGLYCGVAEIRIAPSNTNIAYMMLNGYVYKMTNLQSCKTGGICTWAATGFTQDTGSSANDSGRIPAFGHKIAVDPANASNLIVCTETNGCFESTNGGAAFSAITGLTNASSNWMLADFDPSSTSGGSTPNFYIFSNGHGAYKCTGGLSSSPSCTLENSGTSVPTTAQFMTVQADGTVYLIDNVPSSTLHIFTAGSWTTKSPGTDSNGLAGVAIDPANPTFASNAFITVVYEDGQVSYSQNSGTSWHATVSASNPTRVATDVPWMATGNTNENFMTAGQISYDPAQSNVLYFSEGIGVWTTAPTTSWSSSQVVTYTSQTKGIEQLVGVQILSPWVSASVPNAFSLDRPNFYLSNLNAYPSAMGGVNPLANGTISAWSADWASSAPANMALYATAFTGGSPEAGSSSNGGSSWSAFGANPNTTAGGLIAAGSSTCMVSVFTGTGQLQESSNGGTSWTVPTITGIAAGGNAQGWVNFVAGQSGNRQTVTADRVSSCTFYAYNGGANVGSSTSTAGIYKGVYNGSTWTWTTALSGHIDAVDGFSAKLRSVPGNAGDMFYSSGNATPGPYPHNTLFYECTDSAGTVTCSSVSNIKEVWAFGYGAAISGGSGYPSIYIAGWANCGQTGINNCPSGASGYTWGIWRSTDHASTWKFLNAAPLNSLDSVNWIEGDANNYGRVYVGFSGSGYAYGQFN
jgi:hypothetical protein